MSKWYEVEITDTAWYEVEADSPEQAQMIARDWFIEREPKVLIQELENYNPEEK